MPAPGANLSYHNTSFLMEALLRKIGFKPQSFTGRNKTSLYDTGSDAGTTFPRLIGICAKYSATAPTTNTAADAPTGIGDICLQFKANNTGVAHIDPTQIVVFRCTAYTNTTTFTWASIVA